MIRTFVIMLAAMLPLSVSSHLARAEQAARPLAVVELFTSQGCNSCPPADVFLGELVDRGDVVALSYHIDYWDYLGWKDTLGSPENTARQRAYGRSFGSSSVYTPQMVINGRTHMAGSRRAAVINAMEERAGTDEGLTVDLAASYAGDNLMIKVGPGQTGKQKAHVVLVSFDARHVVEIKRGENRGKSLAYHNAVTAVQTVGVWKGSAKQFELPMSEIAEKGSGGCAVLLQAVMPGGLPGPILGAAMVRFPSG